MTFAVVRAADNEDEAEAFGPFISRERAEKFADDFGEWVNPGFMYYVVELWAVRDAERQIREEIARRDRGGRRVVSPLADVCIVLWTGLCEVHGDEWHHCSRPVDHDNGHGCECGSNIPLVWESDTHCVHGFTWGQCCPKPYPVEEED